MIVAKSIEFDAAHFLPNYVGKCSQLHGHHWKVELAVEGSVMEKHGFVVDFSRLKDWMQDSIINEFDHTCLNDKVDNPTAENIVLDIASKFFETGWCVSGDVKLKWIKVWEAEDSYALLSY